MSPQKLDVLIEYRAQNGDMTQESLGELCGLHRVAINRLETGKYTITTLQVLAAIARATGIAPARLAPDYADILRGD